MKTILNGLYRIFLMRYLERDKYFDELCNEAEKECELILDGTEELEFVVSSMESGKRNRYTMKLDGLPKRPPKTTRIRLRLEYDSPVTCQITAEDLGFGDMFPASHKIWHETMGEV